MQQPWLAMRAKEAQRTRVSMPPTSQRLTHKAPTRNIRSGEYHPTPGQDYVVNEEAAGTLIGGNWKAQDTSLNQKNG